MPWHSIRNFSDSEDHFYSLLAQQVWVLVTCRARKCIFWLASTVHFTYKYGQKCLHPWGTQGLALFCFEFLPLHFLMPLGFFLCLDSSNRFSGTNKTAAQDLHMRKYSVILCRLKLVLFLNVRTCLCTIFQTLFLGFQDVYSCFTMFWLLQQGSWNCWGFFPPINKHSH